MSRAPIAPGLGLALGLLLGFLLGSRTGAQAPQVASCPPALSASAPALASAPSACASAAPAPVELLDDLASLKRLEQLDEQERSVEQAERIARGHLALARGDLAALAQHVARDPSLARDRATLARFAHFLEREQLPVETLLALARIPGAESVDLMYSAWRRLQHTPAGLLARDLVRRREAQEQASPALRALVALERSIEENPARESQAARRCQRLIEHLSDPALNDRRCAPLLAELQKKQGCGGDGAADCYPCLREGDPIRAASERCKKRDPPTPWVLPKR